MKTYSLTEVRQMLHVDNKTLARWLERAGITLQPSQHDERVKRITHEQLQLLASIHERQIGEVPVEKEVRPTVKSLERKVSDLAERVEWLEHHDPSGEVGRGGGLIEGLRERLGQLEDRISEIEAQLHDMRVVFWSEVWRTAPDELKALSTRMDAIEQRLVKTKTRPAPRSPRLAERKTTTPAPVGTAQKRIVVSSPDVLPLDAWPLHEVVNELNTQGFAIKPRGFRDLVDKQFEHYVYYDEARKEWKRYLTTQQQEAITDWLQGRG